MRQSCPQRGKLKANIRLCMVCRPDRIFEAHDNLIGIKRHAGQAGQRQGQPRRNGYHRFSPRGRQMPATCVIKLPPGEDIRATYVVCLPNSIRQLQRIDEASSHVLDPHGLNAAPAAQAQQSAAKTRDKGWQTPAPEILDHVHKLAVRAVNHGGAKDRPLHRAAAHGLLGLPFGLVIAAHCIGSRTQRRHMNKASDPRQVCGGDQVTCSMSMNMLKGLIPAGKFPDDANQVDQGVHTTQELGQGCVVEQIAGNDRDAIVGGQPIRITHQSPYLIAGSNQAWQDVPANKPCHAGDRDFLNCMGHCVPPVRRGYSIGPSESIPLRPSPRPLVIVARSSPLARAQANWVGQAVAAADPQVRVDYLWIESEGDLKPDRPLSTVGGKGLFTRTIEQALLDRRADLAVHSLKDLPTQVRPEAASLTIAAVPRRADVRDCLVTRADIAGIGDLPQGAVLGTSSPRRAAQALRLRPDLTINPIRGNVQTRLKKVLEPAGEAAYDATLMAVAGLTRAGLAQHAIRPVDPEIMLPAAAQGALALQCRGDDHVTLLRCLPLNDSLAAAAAHAERQIVAGLNGDCDSAIAVLAEPVDGGAFRLRARVLSLDGKGCAQADGQAALRHMGKLVRETLSSLVAGGALDLLACGH